MTILDEAVITMSKKVTVMLIVMTNSIAKYIIGSKLWLMLFRRTQILFMTLFFISFSYENSFLIWNFAVIVLVCKIY